MRSPRFALVLALASPAFALVCAALLAFGCSGTSSSVAAPSAQDVDLPGIDTAGFTPRERHELAQYAMELPSPCADIAVPVGQCLVEKRACAACVPAAEMIAQAVRNGLARDQIQDLYKRRFDALLSQQIAIDGSPSRGQPSNPVVLIEFADFECPFCQKLAPELDALFEKHKDRVLFVYKFMPLQMHAHGEQAARAGIAAQMQGKFWEMHHQLFANGQRLEQSDLESYARAIGLDIDKFRADMQSAAATGRLDADRKLADKLGVKGTPSIYINGRPYDSKVDIEQWVDGEIRAGASASQSTSAK